MTGGERDRCVRQVQLHAWGKALEEEKEDKGTEKISVSVIEETLDNVAP